MNYKFADQLSSAVLAGLTLKLPATSDGKPNWDYMESYMKQEMKESKKSLESLILAKKPKTVIDIHNWKIHRLDSIFHMRNTHSITQEEIIPDSGIIPYVTASNVNNGVLTYIDCPEEWKDKGNCIMIGGKTLTFSYQQDDFCSNDSHNLALYAIDPRGANELCYLFMISALRAAFASKYSWDDSISMKAIKDEVFYLPNRDDGTPDWEYMTSYMREIMKQTEENLNLLRSISG